MESIKRILLTEIFTINALCVCLYRYGPGINENTNRFVWNVSGICCCLPFDDVRWNLSFVVVVLFCVCVWLLSCFIDAVYLVHFSCASLHVNYVVSHAMYIFIYSIAPNIYRQFSRYTARERKHSYTHTLDSIITAYLILHMVMHDRRSTRLIGSVKRSSCFIDLNRLRSKRKFDRLGTGAGYTRCDFSPASRAPHTFHTAIKHENQSNRWPAQYWQ